MPAAGQERVGVCVSGGGLRAASFGLGVLQVLQRERGLMRGPHAADYLSAVSGGSYIAGAYTLVNCSDRLRPAGSGDGVHGIAPPARRTGDVEPPFGPESPEADHLRRHSRYMIEEGGAKTMARMFALMLFNMLTILSLAVWAGFAGLGICAVVGSWVLPEAIDSTDGAAWLQWVLAPWCLVMARALLRHTGEAETTPSARTVALRLLPTPLYVVSATALVTRLQVLAPLRSPQWLLDHAVTVGGVVLAVIVATGALSWLGHRLSHAAAPVQWLGRFGVSLLTLRAVQIIGVLVVAWSASWAYIHYDVEEDPLLGLIAFFAVALAPLVLQRFVDRASPHHAYRDLLTRCFSVIRVADDAASKPHRPREVLLSELTPPAPGAEDSFPQLIICAAANVSDVGASPAGSDVLSLTLTGTELAVSGADGASIATHVLERMQRPSSVRSGWGPAMTLASATAMTGAAVSPAMGKQTRNNLRALFAALNIRLGVWLPNPINPSVRDRIADAVAGADAGNGVRPRRGLGWLIQMVPDLADRVDTANPMPAEERATILAERRRVRVGINEMVQELFGLHPSGGTKLYVSDGGHYDNLGLVELLRRRCSVVWVVDASGDRPGTARALSEAILLAGAEVGANVDLDLDRFALDKETDRQGPVLGATHVLGDVRYGDDSRGVVVVIKLGMTRETADALFAYRAGDRRFPHHSTLNQIYRSARFDAYRALGWDSALLALADPAVAAALPVRDESEDVAAG